MAQHEVTYTTPEQTAINSPVKFFVYTEDGKFGELQVNRRGIRWWPKKGKKGDLIAWQQLEAKLMRRKRTG